MPLAAGQPIPDFRLAAAVTGVVVDAAFLEGRAAVLVVHGAKSTDAAKEVARAVRAKQPDAARLALVSVIDLRSFAGLWRRVAEAQLKSTYERLARKATDAGFVPQQHVVLCPDWDGAVANALGFDEPDKRPGAVVVGPDLRVLGVAQGPTMGADAAALVP